MPTVAIVAGVRIIEACCGQAMGIEPERGIAEMLGQSPRQRYPWEGRVELGQTIVSVDASAPPLVKLIFADGYEATLNLQTLLDEGKIFEPLRDPVFFRTAHPGANGGSLEWITADGDEIDLCADALRMEAEGIWDPVSQEWKV